MVIVTWGHHQTSTRRPAVYLANFVVAPSRNSATAQPALCSSSEPDCALKCDLGNIGMALPFSGAKSAYPDQYEGCWGRGGIRRDDIVAGSQRGGRAEFEGVA